MVAVQGRTAAEIFGYPDDLKLRSSMTLFARAAEGTPCSPRCSSGTSTAAPDPRTVDLLR